MKRTAYITIVGRPNVGKSTLLNALLGEKISIVSSKPQTTRNRITGILTRDEDQYVFLDTPGVHTPRNKLGVYMQKATSTSIGEADVVILMAEAHFPAGEIEVKMIERLKEMNLPVILLLNKIDEANRVQIAESIESYAKLYPFAAVVPICAANGNGLDLVMQELSNFLHESEWFFPEDMVTDQPERRIVAETIREKLLRLLSDEIPHGTAVSIEEFKDEDDMLKIRAEIFCEKNSHKGIIVGKNGATLKKIGTFAREDLEKFFGVRVYLNLWVKVKEKWRDSDFRLNDLGYNLKDFD